MGGGAVGDDRVCWRFIIWDGERSPFASQVDGWILKEFKVSFVVTPRTGNSHEVGGEFPDDHLHLLMGGAQYGTVG